MDRQNLTLRFATPADAAALLEIYAPYVRDTAVSFEYEVPSVAEFARRITQIQQMYPYLVALDDGVPVGYAYAHAFVGRKAYDHAAESTIYLAQTHRRQGVGRLLYRALEDILTQMGICSLNACIGYPEPEDEHLTLDSVNFHTHMGYTMVGKFRDCGVKFDRWYSMVWMEKQLAPRTLPPRPVRSIHTLTDPLAAWSQAQQAPHP